MSSINNAGQQPRLCIDLNVAYRAEDDDALNDGRRISQIRVISDSAHTSFSMRHSAPQAQTSLRAPRDQAIDTGKIVVSFENANQRISATSSLPSTFILPREMRPSSSFLATEQMATTQPSYTSWWPEASASSSEVRCEQPGSQSSWLSFASSSHRAGQSGETSEGCIPSKKKYPVPKHLRKPGETDETRIIRSALSGRRLVPVPVELRAEGETDQTRISRNTLSKRFLVPIPARLRLARETDQSRISRSALVKRQLVPVPATLRSEGETDQTLISKGALSWRRHLVPVPEALREPNETEDTKIFQQILQNRKRQRAIEQRSAGIKKSTRS